MEWNYVLKPKYKNIVPQDGAKLMKQFSSVKWTRLGEPPTSSLYLKMLHKALFRWLLVWYLPKSLRW